MTEQRTSDVGIIGGARAFGTMLGGPAALAALATASTASAAHSLARGRRPPAAAALGTAALAVYMVAIRPRLRNWGATSEEARMPLPGDEIVPDPGLQTTHAVTIAAPIAGVWPWLAQIGQDRGGFYSYEWLENLAGCEMRNAEEIHPEWQHRELGETILLHPAAGLKVTLFEPDRALGIEGWGVFVLEPSGEQRTRLLARGRIPRRATPMAYAALLEIPHFLMERRMLLGIRERAERRQAAKSV